jgi:hypothetical protein
MDRRGILQSNVVASRALLGGRACPGRVFLVRTAQHVRSALPSRDLAAAAIALAGIVVWAVLFSLLTL